MVPGVASAGVSSVSAPRCPSRCPTGSSASRPCRPSCPSPGRPGARRSGARARSRATDSPDVNARRRRPRARGCAARRPAGCRRASTRATSAARRTAAASSLVAAEPPSSAVEEAHGQPTSRSSAARASALLSRLRAQLAGQRGHPRVELERLALDHDAAHLPARARASRRAVRDAQRVARSRRARPRSPRPPSRARAAASSAAARPSAAGSASSSLRRQHLDAGGQLRAVGAQPGGVEVEAEVVAHPTPSTMISCVVEAPRRSGFAAS